MNDVLNYTRQNDIPTDDFSLVSPDVQEKINKLEAANDERINLLDDFDPQNPDDVSKKTKLHTDIKQALIDQNGRAADEDDWLERRMKELDLYFNHHKTPAYKNLPLPFVHDVTIHDKHNRELLSWRTGGGSIKIHEAGIFNEAAGTLAAEAAYKKFGHGKVHFNVSNSAKERYKDSMGQICEQKLNQLVAAGFEPEQIVFPKEWQYLVTMKAAEMKNLAEFSEATPEQVAVAALAEKEFNAKHEVNQDVEGAKEAPAKPATPMADAVPAKPAAADQSPVNEQTIPDVPTSSVAADKGVPAAQEAPVVKKKLVMNKCTLVKTKSHADPSKEKYNLIGQKGMVESMSGPTLTKVAQGLVDDAGITIGQVVGCWKSDVPVFTYAEFKKNEGARLDGLSDEQKKESQEECTFKAAYDVITGMKEEAKLAVAVQGVPATDVAVDAVVDVAVSAGLPDVLGGVPAHVSEQIPDEAYDFDKDIQEYKGLFTNSFDDPHTNEPDKPSIEDTERFLAKELGMPEVLDSPEYADLKAARATASGKIEKPKHDESGIDFSVATSALSIEKEKIDSAKRAVKSAIANETRRTTNKNGVV